MKTRIIAFTCALSAAACGGSDTRPAQDPATTSTTASDISPAPMTSPDNSTASTASNAATPTIPSTTTTPTTQFPTPSGPATGSSGPSVAANPGVADQTKNADNTKINDRDRHGALTPMDQGNSGSETKITATIRKGIMSDKTLSFGAKNVKVITVGTKVTLRGPVKSDQERTTIEALAKQAPGVTDVDNQLEVKQ